MSNLVLVIPERLAAIDHDEHCAIGAHPAIAQVGEQRRARGGILRRAFAHAEYIGARLWKQIEHLRPMRCQKGLERCPR